MLALSARAQDPLKPPPIVINRDAAPEVPLQPAGQRNPPAQGARPPTLGGDDTEREVEAVELEGRFAAKSAREKLDSITPEPLWRRVGLVVLMLVGVLGLIVIVALRKLRR
ncbi:MAG: hypothetical protein EXS14_05940 [Planctomycetes bacterium]|nr:hypothetical protein [Planctomycetota bacterium]